MPDVTNANAPKRKPWGCLACLIGVLFLGSIIIIPPQLEPSSRESQPVDITIYDEAGQPASGATLNYEEFEIIPWIPLFVFGPARTIHNECSVTTNEQGKARFGIKYYTTNGVSVSRAGTKLTVIKSETTKTYSGRYAAAPQDGTITRKHSIEGPTLPQWLPMRGAQFDDYHSDITVRLPQ